MMIISTLPWTTGSKMEMEEHPLLQNTFVVSAGKVSLISAFQTDTIYTI
jgi:hypothetical protein